mmetsp:Transcript_31630/g.46921  ORF Transcript_31630/g.46921 Transcript_31630/m.46921 type:complete len:84 (-) Transcript_31630:782-1033(-)
MFVKAKSVCDPHITSATAVSEYKYNFDIRTSPLNFGSSFRVAKPYVEDPRISDKSKNANAWDVRNHQNRQWFRSPMQVPIKTQ